MHTEIYSLDLGPANADLVDLRAQVKNSSGTNVGSEVSSGFTADFGVGKYGLSISVPDAPGFLTIYRSGSAAAPLLVGTYDVQSVLLAGISNKVLNMLGDSVRIVSSISEDGLVMQIVAGDDYSTASGQPLLFTSNTLPDMSGGGWSVVFTVYDQVDNQVVTGLEHVAGTVTYDAASTSTTIQVDLSAALTGQLLPGRGRYVFNLQGHHSSLRMTPIIGELRVLKAYTPTP
jgi:hypothetical protein